MDDAPLLVHADQRLGLLAVYRDRGLLLEVDGMGQVDEVTRRIFTELEQLQAG